MNIKLVLGSLLALAGCATFSPDGGAGKVSELTEARIARPVVIQRSEADVDSARSRAAELLARPLTAESAVEIALLSNRGLQASYSELGIDEAERVRAGRLSNPMVSFGHISGAGITEIDRSVMFDLLGLLALPLADELAQRELEQAQIRAASDTVSVAMEARAAYYAAVAAQQLVGYAEQVKDAADASNELARRMQQAGNFNKLAQLREQAFYADATAQLERARHRALAERERLVRALGLSDDQLKFTLPARLPDLPDAPLELAAAERTAIDKRLDVLTAKRQAEATARSLGLTRATRFINVLSAGYANKSRTGEALQSGYRIELELPLFDFGATRSARAEATYMQAVHRVADAAVRARSEVRESYAAYRTAYALARHYRDDVVPLRARIAEENLLRYNGMLASVFELLADARDQVASVTASVEALRGYWIAQTELQGTLAVPASRAAR